MGVFCDWLTVTVPPDSPVLAEVDSLVDGLAGSREDYGGGKRAFRTADDGLLHVTGSRRWARLSASGRFLGLLRAQGLFRDYLAAIAEVPHTVTRLDASLDQAKDAAPVIRRLDRKYRHGYAFTRKAVPQTSMLQTRFDGARTGSVMLGKDDAQVRLLAYDKQHEAYEKRGEILPPTLRWELRLSREVGVTLRDAAEPAPVFYRFMSPDFLPRPDGVPDWCANGEGWSVARLEPRLPADRLKALLSTSADVARLVELADACGGEGRAFLLGLLRRHLFPEGSRLAA